MTISSPNNSNCYFVVQGLLFAQIPNGAYNMLCCSQYLPKVSFTFDLCNKVLFLALFFICQIVCMTWLDYVLWFYSSTYHITIFCITIQILSVWMHKDHIKAVWINIIKRKGKVVTVEMKEIKTYWLHTTVFLSLFLLFCKLIKLQIQQPKCLEKEYSIPTQCLIKMLSQLFSRNMRSKIFI